MDYGSQLLSQSGSEVGALGFFDRLESLFRYFSGVICLSDIDIYRMCLALYHIVSTFETLHFCINNIYL